MTRSRIRASSTALFVLLAIVAPRSTEGEQPTSDPELPVRMPETARVFLPACESLPFDGSRLLEVLRIELRDDGTRLVSEGAVEEAPPPLEAHLRVDMADCLEGSGASIVVESLATGRAQRRRIELGEDTGRERVLALALAELLRRSWPALAPGASRWDGAEGEGPADDPPEVEDQDQPEPPLAPSTHATELGRAERVAIREAVERQIAESRREEPPLPATLLVDVFADGSAVPTFATGFVGGGVGVSLPMGSLPIRLEPSIGARYGLAVDPLGYVDMATLRTALALCFGAEEGSWLLGIGPSIEVGWSWVEGRPFEAETSSGAFNAPFATLALRGTVRRRLAEWLWLRMGAALGYVIVGFEATAEGRRAGALEGLEISLHLGLSIAPGR